MVSFIITVQPATHDFIYFPGNDKRIVFEKTMKLVTRREERKKPTAMMWKKEKNDKKNSDNDNNIIVPPITFIRIQSICE